MSEAFLDGSRYLAFASAGNNVNRIDLILLEFCIINSHIRAGDTQHNLVSIDHKLFELVTEHAFNNFAVISSGDFLNSLCNILVLKKENINY